MKSKTKIKYLNIVDLINIVNKIYDYYLCEVIFIEKMLWTNLAKLCKTNEEITQYVEKTKTWKHNNETVSRSLSFNLYVIFKKEMI